MTRPLVVLGVLACVGAALARALGWLDLDDAIRVAASVAGVAAVTLTARAAPLAAIPRPDPRRPASSGSTVAPEGEVRLARLVSIAERSAADFDVLVRPRLAAVARRRLAEAGVDLDRREDVESVLGSRGADAVAPSVRVDRDRDDPGVPAEELIALLERLRELG